MTEVDWKIKSINLANKKVTTVATGGSYNNTPTPILRTGKNSVSWIQYDAKTKNPTVTSKLINYDLTTKKTLTIKEEILDESKKSNGEYFILQENVESDKFLLYKSIFKNDEKQFNISLYGKGKKPITLVEKDQIIDFTISKDYFVYTDDGSLTAYKMTNRTQEIKYQARQSTVDTPIFLDSKTLVFRSGMNKILLTDLKKGIYYSISDFLTTSKAIYNNGLLA